MRRSSTCFRAAAPEEIEALSRGANGATFVERDGGAVRVLEANLERAHFAGPAARVVRTDAVAWLARLGNAPIPTERPVGPEGPFAVVLVDPPYDRPDLLLAALDHLGGPRMPLARGAIIVAKHFWRDAPPERIGLLASARTRRFGDTALTFYEVVESAEAQA